MYDHVKQVQHPIRNISPLLYIWRGSKSKSKKTLFNVGQCKQYNISSHLKWVLVADKSMHMIIYNKIHTK